jgi:preprotein translocase SecF subunit
VDRDAKPQSYSRTALTRDYLMRFKGVDFFPHNPGWKIISKRLVFIGMSWVLAILSVVLLMTRGLNYGVDFKGGSLIEVQAKSGTIDIGPLRDRLNKLGLGDVQVQGTLTGAEALIRIGQQENEKEQSAANDKIRAALGENLNVRRVEVVGPTVSSELKRTGVIAVAVSLFGILLYVWFRFEWQFGVAGIVALVHDVLITVGMFSMLWLEFDLSVVAALLTLAGYSINDTVVVFDRIRENLRKFKRMPLEELIDRSINETLSRTVLTSVTTFLAVLALYLFGTEVILGFSFAMLFGIVIGTYSSIFVASPLLLFFRIKREGWTGPKDAKARAATVSKA